LFIVIVFVSFIVFCYHLLVNKVSYNKEFIQTPLKNNRRTTRHSTWTKWSKAGKTKVEGKPLCLSNVQLVKLKKWYQQHYQ